MTERRGILITVCLLAIIFIFLLLRKTSEPTKSYWPKFQVSHKYKKRLSEKEWRHFNYAVSECRKVFRKSPFLQKRAVFWEEHGVEPAVGYAAWLFQESRFNGLAIGDNGRARGYGQIHPPALEEMNNIRKARGAKQISHKDIRGTSHRKLLFFMESLHEYTDLCIRRHGRPNTLKAKLNSWNRGGRGITKETRYSGEIKSMIIQYYNRKRIKE